MTNIAQTILQFGVAFILFNISQGGVNGNQNAPYEFDEKEKLENQQYNYPQNTESADEESLPHYNSIYSYETIQHHLPSKLIHAQLDYSRSMKDPDIDPTNQKRAMLSNWNKRATLSDWSKRASLSNWNKRASLSSWNKRASLSDWVKRASLSSWNKRASLSNWNKRASLSDWVKRASLSNWNKRASLSNWNKRASLSSWNKRASLSSWNKRASLSNWNKRASLSSWNKRASLSSWNKRSNLKNLDKDTSLKDWFHKPFRTALASRWKMIPQQSSFDVSDIENRPSLTQSEAYNSFKKDDQVPLSSDDNSDHSSAK